MTTNTSAVARYGVKLNVADCLIWGPEDLDDADVRTRTVSFWRPMKSLSSGGITRRTAWGRTTWRSDWNRERPSERAAASWLGWTESIPAR